MITQVVLKQPKQRQPSNVTTMKQQRADDSHIQGCYFGEVTHIRQHMGLQRENCSTVLVGGKTIISGHCVGWLPMKILQVVSYAKAALVVPVWSPPYEVHSKTGCLPGAVIDQLELMRLHTCRFCQYSTCIPSADLCHILHPHSMHKPC